MLTVLETASQVQWYVENRRADGGEALAVTPTAAYACQELSQPYLKIEEHAQYARRFVEYGAALEEYLNWEAWLDHWSQDAVPEFKASGFKPARAVTFLLQLLFAEIWATTINLQELLQATKPTRIAFWSPDITDIPWFLQPPISSVPALLPSMVLAESLELIDLSKQAPELRPGTKTKVSSYPLPMRVRDFVKGYLRQSPIFNEVEALQKLGPRSVYGKLRGNSPNVLVSGFGYDLEPLILELRRKGCRISRLRDNISSVDSGRARDATPSGLSAKLMQAGSRLLEEPGLWKPLERWGLDRAPLLSRPLSYWWHNLVPVLWFRFKQVRRLFERKHYAALVTTDCGGTTWGGPDCEAARASQVPRFALQHGGSTGLDAKIWQMYLRGSNGVLVSGEGTVQELEQSRPSYLRPHARLTAVGSSRLDKLRCLHSRAKGQKLRTRLQAGDQRPIILYIPASFGTYGRAVSDLAAYPEVSYLELQQAILKLWIDTPGVRLLYKDLIVANDPTRVMPAFIQKYIPNASVTYQRLTDLMWSVDAIILDHAITALSEVLLTSKRLVVYLPKPNASSPHARTLLEKRATVAETPDEFIRCVRDFLSTEDFSELNEVNDEFLRMYCTHTNNGLSAEQAADVILKYTSVIPPQLEQETTG